MDGNFFICAKMRTCLCMRVLKVTTFFHPLENLSVYNDDRGAPITSSLQQIIQGNLYSKFSIFSTHIK